MQKLFVENISDEKIILDGESARHIAKSLRMRVGDVICVTDGGGEDYGCQIEEITKEEVVLKVCYKQVCESEPSCKVTIYQGVPKSTKLEDIIQKCVELGVTEIVPILTKRCVSRPDDKSAGKKNVRYQKIALEAAQQSGRGIVPKIENMKTLKQALAEDESEVKIVFFEGGGKKLTDIIDKNIKSVSIFIGPEGGFEEAEVEQIEAAGGVRATLGKRILRTQTAPVAGLTAIMLLTGNLE
ncbi:16S rRNA (uracil(1498)-N(3))-methyltransferase [Eubacterium coprostanoligenes]|uniref:16S rRNA (uracil(1498)-N(3))-methyltransferase n=1 Tax=Eubacterium coprostanoligenes TaxID=290054 RepID=UPI002A811CAC|nr:16S rRNA (uracil(1498)-N(3))-methyltransferase [Eubacterium coprostanoligenes]MDY4698454.1 16S rRNA (uracil(1498)-N(3))-methyltransferase [Eubacterium coprostanoligenes]